MKWIHIDKYIKKYNKKPKVFIYVFKWLINLIANLFCLFNKLRN